MTDATNPFLFIVGCPRSGTRLLGKRVTSHSEVAVIHEARFDPGWFRHRRGLTADGYVTREFVELLLAFLRFEHLRVEPASWWERLVRIGRTDGAELPEELYYELRYEDLVADPARPLDGLCAFLELPCQETMLSVRPTRGMCDRRTQMHPEDVQRFEAAAGELLGELGYERSFPGVSR